MIGNGKQQFVNHDFKKGDVKMKESTIRAIELLEEEYEDLKYGDRHDPIRMTDIKEEIEMLKKHDKEEIK